MPDLQQLLTDSVAQVAPDFDAADIRERISEPSAGVVASPSGRWPAWWRWWR
ncbi:hypothetical protein BH24ACT15_BH24ACT15_08080 [soil metagenome]